MALSLESWLPQAQALALGERASGQHECGEGRKLLVEHKEDGWAAWCYRCSDAGWHPKPRPSLAERIKALTEQRSKDAAIRATIRPPMPAVFDTRQWPECAQVWLYRAGFDREWIEDIGFYWCPEAKRLVMPVLDDAGALVFWQARGFDPARPKYLSPDMAGSPKPVYKAAPIRAVADFQSDVLCITEDILSANKVGQVCHGWSILGTSLTPLSEREIVELAPSRVWVWLDPDDAGIKGRRKIVPRLRALGIDAKSVRAELDPKCYPLDEIRKKL